MVALELTLSIQENQSVMVDPANPNVLKLQKQIKHTTDAVPIPKDRKNMPQFLPVSAPPGGYNQVDTTENAIPAKHVIDTCVP